ncbi:MAG: lipoyl synthase [Planctomycetaceae bacterium]|nr:lipoyl synthase [Planctomycetaceae bacterium]
MSEHDTQSHVPLPLPRWLKRNVPKGNANHFTAKLIGQLGLQTVCDHAKCPNRMECYSQKTATFMILGNICTRACRFCSVPKGKPLPPDPDEPRRVAEATRTLGLKHVVITCVTRDDLPDGGAEHFVRMIEEIRKQAAEVRDQKSDDESSAFPPPPSPLPQSPIPNPQSLCSPTIEVLPSDFGGNPAAVDRLVEASPEVYNHNTETVPRLFHVARDPRTDYRWTLEMFRRIHRGNPAIAIKTGLMLGLGETTEELLDTLAELHEAGCRMLTLGQYLQPSPRQMPVVRYLTPDEFDELGRRARGIGFEQVAAGPFVRSSYHAREMMHVE